MTPTRRIIPEGYGVAKVHFREGQDLRDVVTALAGVDRTYSELAFLDGTLSEWHSIVEHEPPSETVDARVAAVIARRLVATANHPDFDASFAVDATIAGARVVTARPSGSWVLELLGKLNPIESLKSVLELVRDWGPDRDKKQLLNSKLAQDVVAQRIANQIAELDLVRQSAELLERGGIEHEQISRFVSGRVTSITGGAIRAAIGVRAADITSAQMYAQRPRDMRILTSSVDRAESAPLLWAGMVLPPKLPEPASEAEDKV